MILYCCIVYLFLVIFKYIYIYSWERGIQRIHTSSEDIGTQTCVSATYSSTTKSKVLKYGQSFADVLSEGIVIATRMTNNY